MNTVRVGKYSMCIGRRWKKEHLQAILLAYPLQLLHDLIFIRFHFGLQISIHGRFHGIQHGSRKHHLQNPADLPHTILTPLQIVNVPYAVVDILLDLQC